MPIYLFKNPINGEIKEVSQPANSEHSYEENGVKFEREFISPNVSVDTKIDCHSSKDFANKTGKKSGTLNDLFEASAELSEKRAQKDGVDGLKTKYYEDYSKKRGGKKHPELAQKEAVKKLESLGVSVK